MLYIDIAMTYFTTASLYLLTPFTHFAYTWPPPPLANIKNFLNENKNESISSLYLWASFVF